MKRGLSVICAISAFSLVLTGCASIPALDKEQSEMVSQYAVGLLLKYDSENHSRLVDTEGFWNNYNTAKRLYDEAEKRYYDELAKENAKAEEEEKNQSELNSSYASSTKDEGGNGENGSYNDGTGGAMVVDSRSISSFLDLSDFTVEYGGNNIVDFYPEDADDLFFVLTSTTGNDLLVIYFNVTNNSSETKNFDVFSKDPIFKLSVNGGNYYSVLKTFVLDDDMSLYSGDFKAGETKRLVLITEVKEETTISSIGLRVTRGNDSITKSLK